MSIPEYLLDTSVIRSMTADNVIGLLANQHRGRLTTSFHVPFELLSGLDQPGTDEDRERDFRRRRGAMRRYYRLIGVDNTYWDLPDAVIKRAFGRKPDSRARESFLVAMMALRDCDTREELEKVLRAGKSLSSEMLTLDIYGEIDSTLSKRVQTPLANGLDFIRNNLDAFFSPEWFRAFMFVNFAAMAGVIQIDEGELRKSPVEYVKEQIRIVVPLYDGSLTIMIEATRQYLANLQSGRLSMPDKNDTFDLQQLSYLRPFDADQIYVTMDRKFRDLINQAAPARAASMEDFIDLMTGT
jgi:predicted nucleic acid-binding protein